MRFRPRKQGSGTPGTENRTLFKSAFLSDRYVPVRGLVYSVLTHEITLFGLMFLSMFSILERARLADQARSIELSQLREVIFLPVLGSGAPAAGASEDDATTGDEDTAEAAQPTEGLSYPGPQPMVSEFPAPTNEIQTVLRPALDNPPTVEPIPSLPNLVQTADAGPVQLQQFDLTEPIEDTELLLRDRAVSPPLPGSMPLYELASAVEVPAPLPEVQPQLADIQSSAALRADLPELELPSRLFQDVARLEQETRPSTLPEIDPRLEEPLLAQPERPRDGSRALRIWEARRLPVHCRKSNPS